MLPAKNRLRTSKEFAQTIKTGFRATSNSLVLYLQPNQSSQTVGDLAEPKIGLIVNKSVGGSVVRHRVSRQLRHLISDHINVLPKNSFLVIRVLRMQPDYKAELTKLVEKLRSDLLASTK